MSDFEISCGQVKANVSIIGGTVTSLTHKGIPIIFPQQEIDDKIRGGIPICFPFFGPAPAAYSEIKQHGWLRDQNLQVIDYIDIDDCGMVLLRGVTPENEQYPWKLEYDIMISVHDSPAALKIKLKVKRLNDGHYFHAPINPAFHPYFCSSKAFPSITNCLTKVGEDVFTDNYFGKDAAMIHAQMPIIVQTQKEVVELVLREGFDQMSRIAFWSDNPGSYYCIEPVAINPEYFADNDRGGIFLGEGEAREFSCDIMM